MKFGVNLPNYASLGFRSSMIDIVEAAEALQFHSAWTTDHILMPRDTFTPYASILESLTTLAFVAGRTNRLELGTSVIAVPQRDPILLAKQAATLSELSAGRFSLGVGVGWIEREFEYLNADFKRRGVIMDEYVKVMIELWTSEKPTFDGELIRFHDAAFAPRPSREGGIPLIMGGASAPALRRAAKFANGWQAIYMSPEDVQSAVRTISEQAPTHPIEISLRIPVNVGSTLAHPYGSVLDGSIDQIADDISKYEQVGVQHLILEFQADSSEQYVNSMREFAQVFQIARA